MHRGAYSLRLKALNAAPMLLFSSVPQIALGQSSVFKTPHTSPPRQQFDGVNKAAGSGGRANEPYFHFDSSQGTDEQRFLLLTRQESRLGE